MQTAIITGGSRGIGEAMAMKLGEMGYNVVINYRSDSSKALAEAVIAKLKENYGVEGVAVQADVSKYEDCEKLVEAAVSAFGENSLTSLLFLSRSKPLTLGFERGCSFGTTCTL